MSRDSTKFVNRGTLAVLPIGLVEPDPNQPRTEFDEDGLMELELSIRKDGVIEPLVVRPIPGEWFGFRLIAGERRWRAARRAGLEEIPCAVRETDERDTERLAIAENDLRRDLKPMERALAYRRFMDKWGLTLEQAANELRKTRAEVEFYVRLTNLRDEYQDALRRGILTSPQACDLARVPQERQPQVFALYRRGADPNHVARIITAILELDNAQTLIPEAGKTAEVRGRLEKALSGIVREIGRCYSKSDLELLGWATDGSIDKNLETLGLIVKQLGHMQDSLRKAKARRTVKAEMPAPQALIA